MARSEEVTEWWEEVSCRLIAAGTALRWAVGREYVSGWRDRWKCIHAAGMLIHKAVRAAVRR